MLSCEQALRGALAVEREKKGAPSRRQSAPETPRRACSQAPRRLGPRMKLILIERSTFTDNTSLGPGSVFGDKGKNRVKQKDIISLFPF